MKHVCDRALTSNNLFDIYYFLNKYFHEIKLIYNSDNCYNTIYAISEQLNKITIKIINDDTQSFIMSTLDSYFFS